MKRKLSMLLSLILTVLTIFPAYAVEGDLSAKNPIGYVTMIVEATTTGPNILRMPERIPFYEGENYAQVTDRFLKGTEYYRCAGDPLQSFYIQRIKADQPITIELPEVLLEKGLTVDGMNEIGVKEEGFIGEHDFSNSSGWMFTVNHVFASTGASDAYPVDGEVVRWQFTMMGYGADLGIPNDWGQEPYFVAANKDAMIKKIGEIQSSSIKDDYLSTPEIKQAYDDALVKLKSLAVSQVEVDACYQALDNAIKTYETPVVTPPAVDVDVSHQLQSTLEYIYNSTPNPNFGTGSGDWSVLALARGGFFKDYPYPVEVPYFETYYTNVLHSVEQIYHEGKLDKNKGTEHSRVILGLSAIGRDARKVGPYDVTAALSDFGYVSKQGLNGPIFALIAMDSANYVFSENPVTENQTTRGKCIDYILSKEINAGVENAGGWSFFGSTPDPDMTGMALQALAPYYLNESAYQKSGATTSFQEFKATVDRALNTLSQLQRPDGGFASWGTTNAESCAQVIVATTALGINPATDEKFVKEKGNLITALLDFYVEGGGFSHVKGSSVNGMATDQSAYALVAYERLKQGKNSLYNMTDAYKPLDSNAPTLSDYKIIRKSENALSVVFSSDESGQYLYQIAEKGTLVPNFDGVSAQNLEMGVNTIERSDLKGTEEKILFLQAMDSQGNQTEIIKQMIPAVTQTEPVPVTDTIDTNLVDGKSQKGSKLTFDVWARNQAGQKIDSKVTLNGQPVKVNWNDNEKTSFTLRFTKEGSNEVVISAGTAQRTFTITYTKAQIGEVIGQATFTVEAFTLGAGYLIDPCTVDIREGENGAQLLDRVLKENGYHYDKTGTLENSFYLAVLYGGRLPITTLAIPEVLKSKLQEIDLEDIYEGGLGEFNYTNGSGWMYSVNNVFPNVGFADYFLGDGDVMRVQFTTALGNDIGGGEALGGGAYALYRVANKDDVTRYIAQKGINNVSKSLLKAIQTLDISYQELLKIMKEDATPIKKPEVQTPNPSEASKSVSVFEPTLKVDKGIVITELTSESIKSTLNSLKEKNGGVVVIQQRTKESVHKVITKIEAKALKAIQEEQNIDVSIENNFGTVYLPNKLLKAQFKESDIVITVEEEQGILPKITLDIKSKDKSVPYLKETPVKLIFPIKKDLMESGSIYKVAYSGKDQKKEYFVGNVFESDHQLYMEIEIDRTGTIEVTSEKANYFNDLSTDKAVYKAANYALQNGLMVGNSNGAFEADQPLTRAMMVAFLHRFDGGVSMKDDSKKWYSDAFEWAQRNNILSGYGNGKLGENDVLTEQQMISLIHRYLMNKERVTHKDDNVKLTIETSPWARRSVMWAMNEKLISQSAFKSERAATRGSLIQLIFPVRNLLLEETGL